MSVHFVVRIFPLPPFAKYAKHGARSASGAYGAGNVYGTTYLGGINNQGVLFQLTNSGSGWTESVLSVSLMNALHKKVTLRKSDRKHLADFIAVLLLDLVALDLTCERPSGRERILLGLRIFSNGAHLKLP